MLWHHQRCPINAVAPTCICWHLPWKLQHPNQENYSKTSAVAGETLPFSTASAGDRLCIIIYLKSANLGSPYYKIVRQVSFLHETVLTACYRDNKMPCSSRRQSFRPLVHSTNKRNENVGIYTCLLHACTYCLNLCDKTNITRQNLLCVPGAW